ncbi:MAG TPA: gluconate 2-dehydrogenase subunit 3 family protein [Vicinamibacterales bacterium]|jgi:gluconate 2-dehydrogenase gamma chain|nr:gluconate 2-dehydrogenase subunit 3 family protein [Vicinamibacterales bacterium]
MSISRRSLLKRLGLAGTAAAVPVPISLDARNGDRFDSQSSVLPAAPAREAYETLTAAESDVLEAMTARLIPSDENGPGAREARAAHYIDRALGGPLSGFRASYAAGLAALDAYAKSTKGAAFAQLPAADQDALLADLQGGTATGFAGPPASFFNQVRSHTIEGTFSDPYYGGNASFVGWDLIGYPGVRTSVTPAEQQMGATVEPNHRSAYDFAMFRKGGRDGR